MAPRACVPVYARVLVPPNLYIHAYIDRDRYRKAVEGKQGGKYAKERDRAPCGSASC